MKKAKTYILLCIFMLLWCSGCADVPENVKNDILQYNSNTDLNTKGNEYKYISVNNIADDFKLAIKKDYGQFQIDSKIKHPTLLNVYEMEFEYVDGFCDNADEIFRVFFEDEILEKQDVIDDDSKKRLVTRKFYNDKDKVYCCVGNNGFTAMLQPSAFDNSFARANAVTKTYHIDRDELSDDSYNLLDGECTIKDAVFFVNDWLNTEWKRFENYYDFSVKTVMVRELNNKYYFDFVIEKYYNGIPLNEISDPVMSQDVNGYSYVKHTYSNIRINMMNCYEISSFTNETGIIKPTNVIPIESIISLESVLELCRTTFSDFQKVEISDINLKYNLSPNYKYLGEEIVSGNMIIVNSAESDTQAGVKVVSRLVWEIIIDVHPSEYGSSSEFNKYGDIKKYICIDVESGEIYHCLSLSEVIKFAK